MLMEALPLSPHVPRLAQALESRSANDDTKWLTFWFVYTLFSFVKSVVDYFFKLVLPFYNEAMIAFVVYLGFGGGAQLLYENILRVRAIDMNLARRNVRHMLTLD